MQTQNPTQSGLAYSSTPKKDCLSPIICILMFVWICMVTYGQNTVYFLVTGIIPLLPNRIFALLPLVQFLLLGFPLLLFVLFWRNKRYKVIFQTWFIAVIFGLFMLPTYIPPVEAAQFRSIIQISMGLLFVAGLVLLLWRRCRRNSQKLELSNHILSVQQIWALIIAIVFFFPWLAWGAFGSSLDTLLELVTGLVFGIVSVVSFEAYLPENLGETAQGTFRDYLFTGFNMGTMLLIITSATGFPFGGMQLILMLCIPVMGIGVVGLLLIFENKAVTKTIALAIVIGFSFAAPLMLYDADELSLLYNASQGEVLNWAFYAALVSFAFGWLLIFIAVIRLLIKRSKQLNYDKRNWSGRLNQKNLSVISLLIVFILGGIIYVHSGHPGFYGEGLFVILKDQADVSKANQISDYNQRRQYVYSTLVEFADNNQASLRQSFDRMGLTYTPYYLVNAIQVNGGPLLRIWLLTRPEVDRVLNNPWLRPLPTRPPAGTGNLAAPTSIQWNIALIGADRVWEDFGVNGQGIIIGQSDSGVQFDHPELASAYRGRDGDNNYNWYDPWYGTTKPTDIFGHGTHTLGIILGQHTGIAPSATWYACANLARPLGNPALYLDCMQFMLAPFPQNGNPLSDGNPALGAQVINNSWGCPEMEGCDANSLLNAVKNLHAAGVFVVASAGNDGPWCASLNIPPALYQDAFSVGAIDSNGQLAFFSSIGPVTADGSNRIKPDILAPGVEVLSSTPGNTYATYSGTSMAGPHVVGVVALIWSANPTLIGDIDQTQEIIIQSARPYTGTSPNCPGANSIPSTATGYGIIDAYNAVRLALNLPDR